MEPYIIGIIAVVALIDLTLRFFAFWDLYKTKDQRTQSNLVIWIIVVLLINFGWLIYLLFGRIPRGLAKDEQSWD
ncbi:MAG: PLDc N-terminal domain-containing protein [Candidatus Heimdallarchaeaceae archaeon]